MNLFQIKKCILGREDDIIGIFAFFISYSNNVKLLYRVTTLYILYILYKMYIVSKKKCTFLYIIFLQIKLYTFVHFFTKKNCTLLYIF